jgi:transcriptional regulator with XRE-family HTH domain
MTPLELTARRKALGLNQSELAKLLGLSLRGYQKLEGGESAVKHVYELAMDRVALICAASTGNITLAPPPVRHDALKLAQLITSD